MVCEPDFKTGKYNFVEVSLNPCFNGIWSAREKRAPGRREVLVLILVLMEYGLRVSYPIALIPDKRVLILVLMEYGLRADTAKVLGVECNRS